VTIEVDSPGTSEGLFDGRKLERVFHNLLLNACEAVSPASGKVGVHVAQAKDHIEIRITDNGRGIPEALREKIFEPFFTEGKANGTGLGLTIAQKIVQDHGGKLGIEPSSGLGSTFSIVLPLKPAADNVTPSSLSTSTVGAQG
jgi:signal transduction histidine kinase